MIKEQMEQLRQKLRPINGRDYGAYQSLKGVWQFPDFELHIDRIPKDPFAPPGTGVFRVRVARDKAGFPDSAVSSAVREVALRDYLARQFHRHGKSISKGRRGTGNSGLITIAEPLQEILERSSVVLGKEFIEARFFIGMPAKGRRVQADIAETMLFDELPQIVHASLFAESLDIARLNRHVETAEDAEFLRERLPSLGMAAFVVDGALLPRASGVDPKPLDAAKALKFKSPENLRISVDLPNVGAITGMGIPKGVTLIVGGGYHGKSTLLQALESGVYNHVPGDGREFCVSLPDSAKVRAASGRSVVNVDISAFINEIPLGGPTTSFTSANASGSTSQAAFIVESIEAGASVILIDEDTSATNFMIRDRRMQELVAKKNEPITPFVDKVRQLYEEHGISTIIVMGGSGDYLGVADCVIQMTEFEPHDVTARAHEVAERFTTKRAMEGGGSFKSPRPRFPVGDGLDPRNEYGHFRINAPEPHRLVLGKNSIDLHDVEQLVEAAQTKAIGRAIHHALKQMDGKNDLRRIAEKVMDDIKREGLDVLDPNLTGDLAGFRKLEFAAVLNRIRNLEVPCRH